MAARKKLLVLIGICTLLAGCGGDGSRLTSVVGKVTAHDRPLSGATITIQPIGETSGPSGSASIFDGAFEIPASAGLHGGRYRVQIAMMPVGLRKKMPVEMRATMPTDKAVVHPRYDTNSELTCDLKPGEETVLSFEVKLRQ